MRRWRKSVVNTSESVLVEAVKIPQLKEAELFLVEVGLRPVEEEFPTIHFRQFVGMISNRRLNARCNKY
jgi:hypothetical protein